ncbi:MAG TPA: hypothetical protein VKZ81_19215 [Pseudonocardia sp.]|jgi:hypothetical protein|uniref:hypothetical protein n=1 Tax=Pseudonocardia sp. TaxID=60912 RepID=UPI002B4B27F3|nr:hypothetical protein [Pseudonocardia sp.]HLU57591.1 hypothetical protein [Pseudonocardia sp.]
MSVKPSAALTVVFVVIGVITATPVLALADPEVLRWTYGVTDPDPMTLALLQHRGVLQLALGAALVWAGLFAPARVPVAVGASVTKGTFLALLLPHPALREDVTPFSVVFDAACLVFFAAFLAATARARRIGARSSAPAAGARTR